MVDAGLGSFFLVDLRFTIYDLWGGKEEGRMNGMEQKANRKMSPPRGGQGVKNSRMICEVTSVEVRVTNIKFQ